MHLLIMLVLEDLKFLQIFLMNHCFHILLVIGFRFLLSINNSWAVISCHITDAIPDIRKSLVPNLRIFQIETRDKFLASWGLWRISIKGSNPYLFLFILNFLLSPLAFAQAQIFFGVTAGWLLSAYWSLSFHLLLFWLALS